MGEARAFEVAYLVEWISAAQALDRGMINRVVLNADLDASVAALAGGWRLVPRFGTR